MLSILSSVRHVYAVFLFFSALAYNFTGVPVNYTSTMLEGSWVCDMYSKKVDENITIEKQCLGNLKFRTDHKLVSTCSDGLFPSGTKWDIEGNQVTLSDSEGTEFTRFDILQLDGVHLQLLSKKGILYTFEKV